jgi:hypothetical protein
VKFPKETTDELTDAGERRAGVRADAGDNRAGVESNESSGPRFLTVSFRTGAGEIGELKALRAEPCPETRLGLAWPWLPGGKPGPLVMIGNRYGILRRGEVWYNSVGRGRDGPGMSRGCEAPKGEPKTEDGPEIDSRRRRRLEVSIAFLAREGEPNASPAGTAGDPK